MRAEELLDSNFTQEDLSVFSVHVNSVYDGSRGFRRNHAPCRRGTEKNFATFARVVYDRALELRVVGY